MNETFIILLSVILIIICLHVIREIYLKHSLLSRYTIKLDTHIHDDDNTYKTYVYNALRVQ
jgi:hypothetical protein